MRSRMIMSAGLLLIFLSCSNGNMAKQQPAFSRENPSTEQVQTAQNKETVAAETLAEWILQGKPLIIFDVRNEVDAQAGGVPGAVPGNYDDLLFDPTTVSVEPGDTIVVYCYSGIRSLRVTRAMREAGLAALSLTGGIHGWEAMLRKRPELAERLQASQTAK